MHPVKITVARSGEATFAIVTADVTTKELQHDAPFLSALTKAVTNWIKNFKDGRKRWMSSCEDFNVGDLSACVGYDDLKEELKLVGINDLEIEIFTDDGFISTTWTYDTVLVER